MKRIALTLALGALALSACQTTGDTDVASAEPVGATNPPAGTVASPSPDAAPRAAATPARAAQPASPFNLARMKEDIRILSSDEFEGRGPATPAEKKTTDYIVREMQAAGLQPGGVNGSWYQPVGLNFFKLSDPVNATVKVGRWSKPLAQGIDVALRTRFPQQRFRANDAPIVFVGYGVDAPDRGWDDYKGVDLKGKIALVLVNDPDFETDQPAPSRRDHDLLRSLDLQVRGTRAQRRAGRHRRPRDRARRLRLAHGAQLQHQRRLRHRAGRRPRPARAARGLDPAPRGEELFKRAGLDFTTAKDLPRPRRSVPWPCRTRPCPPTSPSPWSAPSPTTSSAAFRGPRARTRPC
jgi:hypothetical protein